MYTPEQTQIIENAKNQYLEIEKLNYSIDIISYIIDSVLKNDDSEEKLISLQKLYNKEYVLVKSINKQIHRFKIIVSWLVQKWVNVDDYLINLPEYKIDREDTTEIFNN